MDVRDKKQKEVVDLYIEKSMLRSTLVLGTGFGKSKVVCDIIKRTKPTEVLILVNSLDLKGNMWPHELEKWGLGKFPYRVETYQTVYKWSPDEVDLSDTLVIADEVDFSADTLEYSKFFDNFPMVKTLGVTGFITEKKRMWFDIFMPIIYEYSTGDAQDDELLNKVQFKFIKYELSQEKTLRVDYKKNGQDAHFMTSESASYDYGHKQFLKLVAEQGHLRTTKMLYPKEEYDEKYEKLEKRILFAINNRNKILLNSDTSARIARELKEEVLKQHEDNKVIVFSVRTKQSEKICDNVYNGKEKGAVNEEKFLNFNSSNIRDLGVCSKVNRGVNFNDLNTAIFETFYSSDTDMHQRLGRLTRLHRGDVATAYILLPYYREKKDDEWVLSETQQVKWARKAL